MLYALALETSLNMAAGQGLAAILVPCSKPPKSQPLAFARTRRAVDRIKLRSAGAYLDEWFETDPIKAPIVFDGIVGTYSSPLSGRHVFPIIVAAG